METLIQHARPQSGVIRLGAVAYLNTLPLVEGLAKLRDVSLVLAPPAELIGMLLAGDVDLALASVIDARRYEGAALVPVGMIGSDGPSLTVRLFSRVPMERLTRVHADAESHTSVALMQVILRRRFGRAVEVVEFDARSFRARSASEGERSVAPEAILLIGDKVMNAPPPADEFPHQLDLGQAWKELTGLPFVYAVWMCRADEADSAGVRLASAVLDRQRRRNAMRLSWIAAARAGSRGWNAGDAERYLRENMRYTVEEEHVRAVERFFDECAAMGIVARRETRWAGRRG